MAEQQDKPRATARAAGQGRRVAVTWIVVGVIVVGLVSALVAFIMRQGAIDDRTDGGFGVGSSGVVGQDLDPSRVRLDVYFDFMCPYCGLFEDTQSATLEDLRSQGVVDVYYHPLAYLDDQSAGAKYSTRAASAAALIAHESPESFVGFVRLLMANQPAEGTRGLSDEQIQKVAAAAGVKEAVVVRIPDHDFSDWVRSASEAASQGGVLYTPTLGFDGEIQDPTDPASVQWAEDGALRRAIVERADG